MHEKTENARDTNRTIRYRRKLRMCDTNVTIQYIRKLRMRETLTNNPLEEKTENARDINGTIYYKRKPGMCETLREQSIAKKHKECTRH